MAEEDLKSTILDLITELSENVFTKQNEKDDMTIIEFFFTKMSADSISAHVIKTILPHASKIMNRDTDYFLSNEGIFSGLSKDKIQYYGDIIRDPKRMTEENRDIVWQYLDTILMIATSLKKTK